jgi:hypothetical protein
MEINTICTRSDFARIIGRTRGWVTNKIKRHGHMDVMQFCSVEGRIYNVRLIRAIGTKKELICIVSIVG